MEEQEVFFQFVGDAEEFYNRLNDPSELMALSGQLLYIADNNEVDDETVRDYPIEDDLLKITFGPPFTLVFKNLLNGNLVIYVIRRPSF